MASPSKRAIKKSKRNCKIARQTIKAADKARRAEALADR